MVRTLSTLLLGALLAGSAPHGAPTLPESTRRVVAGGVDSLGRATLARDVVLEPRTTVPPDVPQAALDARLAGRVTVRARVTQWGTVDSVVAISGDPRLRAAAMDAVRWYVYAPQAEPAWTLATITIDGREETDPLGVDILGLIRDAERDGRWRDALEAYTGALRRLDQHPTLRNPWALRLRAVRTAARLGGPGSPGGSIELKAIATRVQQQRTVARAAHADLVADFETCLQAAPWWGEVYQWEAASLLGCGRSSDAIRDLLLFRVACPDSVSRERAERALAGIAAGDTVVVGERLKREGRQFEAKDETSN